MGKLLTLPKRQIEVPDGKLYVPRKGCIKLPDGRVLAEFPKLRIRDFKDHRVWNDELGAWTVSGLYVTNWIDILDATQLAIDLSLTSHKWAMYDNSNTPNYSSDTAYSATNEVSGTGYSAGGRTISAGGGNPTTTESPTGTLKYDQDDMVWPAPTSVTAYGAKLYADALAGDNLILGMYFGGAFTSTAGTFTIQFASGGVFTIDLTP